MIPGSPSFIRAVEYFNYSVYTQALISFLEGQGKVAAESTYHFRFYIRQDFIEFFSIV